MGIKIEVELGGLADKIQEMINDAINDADIDFSDAVESAASDIDFSSAVEDAASDLDLSSAVESAVEDVDFEGIIERAFKAVLRKSDVGDVVADLVKRALAIQFGMVTAETHQEETAEVRNLAAKVTEQTDAIEAKDREISELKRQLAAIKEAVAPKPYAFPMEPTGG